MLYLFEAKVAYREDGADKPTKRTFLVQSLTYGEAEINVTKFIIDYEDIEDFGISNITNLKRVSFDDFVYRLDDDDYKWFEAKISMKLDGDKETSFSYLVADSSVGGATVQLEAFVSDSDGDTKVTLMKERDIADIVIRKVCCEVCVMNCESNVRILGFDEQKDIDMKFSDLEDKERDLMEELGAISVSHKKFVIKVTKKALEKMEGKRIGQRVLKTWEEDFIDEDSGEVVKVERSEVLLSSGVFLDEYSIGEIMNSGIKEIKLYL